MKNGILLIIVLALTIPGHAQHNPEIENTTPWEGFKTIPSIHDANSGEAYPWISSDGLRLYFSKGDLSGSGTINMLTRSSRGQSFGDPVQLRMEFQTDDQMSCWLSEDEREIYYIEYENHGHVLYYAKRPDLRTAFSVPQKVELELGAFESKGDLYAPSLTPDGKQLYLYNSRYNAFDRVLVFQRIDESVFEVVDSLHIPGEHWMLPGQLSRDGLRYYLSMSTDPDMERELYEMRRNSLNEPFQAPTKMNVKVSTHAIITMMPSITADGKTMAYVQNNMDGWNGNDLYIVDREDIKPGVAAHTREVDSRAYPNPTSDVLTVDYELPSDSRTNRIAVYSIEGQLKLEEDLSHEPGQFVLDVNTFPAGVYFYNIITSHGVSGMQRFVVQH